MKRFIKLTAILMMLPALADAQIYELVERSNPWHQGRNINGLRNDSTTVSYAELFGGYQSGAFRQHHEALSSWKTGLIAESMLHLDNMSMKGMFTFEHQQYYGMCGSMLVRQNHYPINIIEFTPGTKIRQKYAFDGGVSYDLSPEWRIGGKLGFTSMNFSKRKDLRHLTYLLDLWLAPSVLWHRNDFQVGLSYMLSKNGESVKASQIGDNAEEYMVFLDKGVRYGAYENWEGNGVHLKEAGSDGLPIKEIFNGVALQFSWKCLYIDSEYLYGTGKAGEKDLVWYEFPSHQVKTFLYYRMYRPEARHHFGINFRYKYLENHENILEKKNEGGVTIARKYASNLILKQEELSVGPTYEIIAKKWRIRWKGEFRHTKGISSQIYPYLCSDMLIGGSTSLEAWGHLGDFEIGGHVGFEMDSIFEGNRILDKNLSITPPVKIQSYSNQWLDYRQAPKLKASLALRYNFGKGLYLEVSGNWLRALKLQKDISWHPNQLTGPDRWNTDLKIGLNF